MGNNFREVIEGYMRYRKRKVPVTKSVLPGAKTEKEEWKVGQ